MDLGATWQRGSSRFGVCSAHAETVHLCLFDGHGRERRVPLERCADAVWRVEIPDLRPGQLYGLRAAGRWRPSSGDLFDDGRLLVDPMAKALTGEPEVDDDGAVTPPKCLLVDDAFDWRGDAPPAVPWRDTLIYECHVGGMTRRHPEVDEALRGTYLGLASPPVVDHLRRLGVTAVELLPVQQFASEHRLRRLGLRNYWGYNPLAFCAPHAGYATGGRGAQVVEFKTMVRELHRAGLEVLLDVVFNHTAEGDHEGPVLSLKGLDNRGSYRLDPTGAAPYVDDTGCGNTLDFSRAAVREMTLESLRYWVREMHVDGFRFDLATVLGRGPAEDGRTFDAGAPLFQAIAADPMLSRVKLIAEPWDVGPDGYQLGRFPAGWAEWNDLYRGTVRGFWRGDRGLPAELATRWAASRDLFAAKGPLRSIHYVACHDGFTLADLVSYERKHNRANGENDRDGSDDNRSRNWGHEGPTADAAIGALRDRARRNLLATLMLSQGVPMLQHGDELGRTQGGNNNAYCQDGELTWVDWSAVDDAFLDFVRRLSALRRRLRAFWRESFLEPEDLRWWHPAGREMDADDWHDPDGRALGILSAGEDGRDLLLLLNGGDAEVRFLFPERFRDRLWRELLDTATVAGSAAPAARSESLLAPFSMKAFAGAPTRAQARTSRAR